MAGSLGEHTFARQLAPLRAAPDESAEQVSQVLPGERLAVEERRDGWLQVRTPYDYPGWVRAEAVGDTPLEHARALLGAPYEWGGMSERGIDCSGLVHMAFRGVGILVPRDADQQEAAGVPVDEPAAGDLVTYGGEAGADHIAFWLGEGRILHATGREGVRQVVEEPEPAELATRRRRFVRLSGQSLERGSESR
jgi:hypothetical protein